MRSCSIKVDGDTLSKLPSFFNTHNLETIGLFDEIWQEILPDGTQVIKSRVSPYSARKNVLQELFACVSTVTFAHRGVEHEGKVIALMAFDIIG